MTLATNSESLSGRGSSRNTEDSDIGDFSFNLVLQLLVFLIRINKQSSMMVFVIDCGVTLLSSLGVPPLFERWEGLRTKFI